LPECASTAPETGLIPDVGQVLEIAALEEAFTGVLDVPFHHGFVPGVDQRTGAVSIWWATADKVAVLHGLTHQTLNLNNYDLDEKAGISLPGQYK